MGCDLIGYILSTPKKLTQAGKTKADNRAKKILKLAEELVANLNEPGAPELEESLTEKKFKPVVEVMDGLSIVEGDDEEDLLQSITLLTRESADMIECLRRIVEERDFRSILIGNCPGNRRRQILVTAIQSWGDGFEQDTPGWWIERAFALGIMDDLGIESL